ncbi:SDR family oxidoreductase [Gracilibacillus caseinilyticus]|uniref:SDR family oxidoreductase n=1 Tax=Gracilibacillus caseinilyticus TaxID=2932256 RepID=A0ABY4EYX5_9BACI|nr:SDR family oxidoreductase [Gracilibacillus caseinilyticus]UOQ48839.1 SDR family oxidoreductase [Gracilibacillus caseinilyticus]
MNTVLITGGSSGIGYEFAKLFAQKQYRIILASRNEEKLQESVNYLQQTYVVDTYFITVDLATSNGPDMLYNHLKERSIEIDVLINNAGRGSYGMLHEQSIKSELDMVQLNVHAVSHLMMLFLKDMVDKDSGRILNIGSTTSFYPCPLSANYSASKAFVLYLTEAVATELEGTNVSVTALCPGATTTDFFKNAKMDKQKVSTTEETMDPQKVAAIGFKAMMKRKKYVIPGFQNWLLSHSPRLFPRSTVTSITRRVLEKKK